VFINKHECVTQHFPTKLYGDNWVDVSGEEVLAWIVSPPKCQKRISGSNLNCIYRLRPNLIQKVNAAKVLSKFTHQRAGLQTYCKMGDPESGRISPQKWPEPCPRHSMSIQSW